MRDRPTQGRPRKGSATVDTTRVKTALTDLELQLLDLAVDVARHRGMSAGMANRSGELARRVVPGLVRDVDAWREDPSLPAELRERARRLLG